MIGWTRLAWRRLAHDWVQSLTMTLCLALALFLPAAAATMMLLFETDLRARGAATPLVAGAPGNRFDLVLAALYFRPGDAGTIPYGTVEELGTLAGGGDVVPLHVRFTAQGSPLVCTDPTYFTRRGLRPEDGTLPRRLGDAAVGAHVAAALGLRPGDMIFSDQQTLYDIARPSSLRLHVVGVLAPTGTADDDAVFTTTRTAWILEGLAHGHDAAATQLEPDEVLGRTDDTVLVSPSLVTSNEVTDANRASFHFHGDEGAFPITAALVFPPDAKSRTILRAHVNEAGTIQVVGPVVVVEELIASVVRVKRLFDGLGLLLLVATAALIALVMGINIRMRQRERETLHRIGCARWIVVQMITAELAVILVVAMAIALGGVMVLARTGASLLDLV